MSLGYLIEDGVGSSPTPSTQPIRINFQCGITYGGSSNTASSLAIPLTDSEFKTLKVKLNNPSIYTTVQVRINDSPVGTISDSNEHTYDISGKTACSLLIGDNMDVTPNGAQGYFELS